MNLFATRRALAIAGLVFLVLVGVVVFLQQRQTPVRDSFTIATGSENGMYHRFGQALVGLGLEGAGLRQSGGSNENLDMLRAGDVDFALVQNDLAQYSALGIRQRERFDELSYVMPVFPEYVQVIVPQDSELRVFGDLRGQQICVGNSGSGTYYNSIDVLEEAGLREGVDFFPVAEGSFDCLERLDQRGDIAAVFLTSNRLVAQEDDRYRQLFFSDSLASALDGSFEYFRVLRTPVAEDASQPQLAVDAYLATRSNVPQELVARVTNAMITQWPQLQAQLPDLPDIYVPDVRETIPYHPGSNGELEEAGLKQFNWLIYAILVPVGLLFLLCVWVENRKFAYNRLGENPYATGWQRHVMRVFGWWSRHFIAITLLGLFIVVSVLGLRWIEDQHALSQGTVSPFAQLDLMDSFVWLFTYIGNGFTADDIYPASFQGKVVVGVLAVFGFAFPITAIFYLINVSARKAERNQEGLGYPNFRHHVVVCGWNEKAKGLVTTLTGVNIPAKKKVVIVAQPDERFPLEKFKFNDRLVGFCRGSPSDRGVLERAGVADADSVIVLADFAGNHTRNKGSILAAMNVRELNANAHVCAELEYIDNVDLFHGAECQTLIYTQLVACRAATMAVLSPNLIDFVLDCVTYHDSKHDELYSVAAQEVIAKLQMDNPKVADLRLKLAKRGVNVVGVVDDSYREAGIDPGFTGGEDNTLVDLKYRERPLDPNATIVFAAQQQRQILEGKRGHDAAAATSPEFNLCFPDRFSIVVCSGPATLATLESELRSLYGDALNFVGIDLSTDRPRTLDRVEGLVPDDCDVCLILNTLEERTDLDSMEDVNEADSDIMLLAGLFSRVRKKRGAKWEIIGEVGNFENIKLLKTAGADHALPVSMIVERFLAKEVYDRNHVVDFLMAAMRLSDGVHLHHHVVEQGDGFCGQRFDSLLATQIDGIRILGWRPKNAERALRNRDGDFGYHYRMVIDDRIKNQIAAEGDIIIMMVRRRDRYPNASIVRPEKLLEAAE